MALITCSECGNQISDKALSCPKCGAPAEVVMQAKKKEANASKPGENDLNSHKGTETTYYNNGSGVRVTNTRFIVDNATYALNGIASIRTHLIPPNKTYAILTIITSLILALYAYTSNNSSCYWDNMVDKIEG